MREPEEGNDNPCPSTVKNIPAAPSNSKSLPPSVLRRGKFDVPLERAQPIDLSIIAGAFGEDATLYHVLRIQPCADAAEIRKAYLREGRATLLDGGRTLSADLADVPELQKKKFQAISIAYEILSSPQLRTNYDQFGVVYPQSPTPPTGAIEPRRQNSVRWKPYVEEKIILDSHPDEHSRTSDPSDKREKAQQKQEQEYGWLESHMRNIDEEAEKFLVGDSLESFVDERFTSVRESIGSLIGSMGSTGSADREIDDPVVEKKKPKRNFLVQKLRAKRRLFRKEPRIAVAPYQSQVKDESTAVHSPFSVACFDGAVGVVGACGLADQFYDLLNPDDDSECCEVE